MTLAQLKRHLDRRFDRLERTKADKSDFTRFATKEDLARLATKDDSTRLAAEMNRRFDSLNAKIDSVLRFARYTHDKHEQVLDEHEPRLRDLERAHEVSS